jgi:hypothetical protein
LIPALKLAEQLGVSIASLTDGLPIGEKRIRKNA